MVPHDWHFMAWSWQNSFLHLSHLTFDLDLQIGQAFAMNLAPSLTQDIGHI
jgi:hypothetical protein